MAFGENKIDPNINNVYMSLPNLPDKINRRSRISFIWNTSNKYILSGQSMFKF